jgi:hypothetical protein
MVSAVETDPNGIVRSSLLFRYDVRGRRIAKIVRGGESYFSIYNGDHTWIDFDQSGAVSSRYLFGDGIDEILARERVSDGLATYATGKLGTVEDVIGVDSGLRAEYGYKALGEARVGQDQGAKDRFRSLGVSGTMRAD